MNFKSYYSTILDNLCLQYPDTQFVTYSFGEIGVVNFQNLQIHARSLESKFAYMVIFCDAEPLESELIETFLLATLGTQFSNTRKIPPSYIMATSDYCDKYSHIKDIIDNFGLLSYPEDPLRQFKIWYFFSHGFIASDWFRGYRVITKDTLTNRKFHNKFIMMNRLVDGARNYRLILTAKLAESNILHKGLVSCTKYSGNDGKYLLPASTKKIIEKHCANTRVFDTGEEIPNDSMHINLDTHLSSFLNVVTETCFYDNRFTHLTEKIFKPIVMMQPFILVSSKGALAYLKRYGFKTFDKWIDESYDNISDPFRRIDAIAKQVERISCMSDSDVDTMFTEMIPILEHNRNHFYGEFYNIISDEMWTNFNNCTDK